MVIPKNIERKKTNRFGLSQILARDKTRHIIILPIIGGSKKTTNLNNLKFITLISILIIYAMNRTFGIITAMEVPKIPHLYVRG